MYDQRFVVDVGGIYHYTTEKTLRKSVKLGETIDAWKSSDRVDDVPFVDRDGVLFYHILAFLRNGTIGSVPPDITASLMIEAAYFHLRDMETQLQSCI